MVVESGKKFKVLVNYVQRGTEYTSKEVAESQARKLREAHLVIVV